MIDKVWLEQIVNVSIYGIVIIVIRSNLALFDHSFYQYIKYEICLKKINK